MGLKKAEDAGELLQKTLRKNQNSGMDCEMKIGIVGSGVMGAGIAQTCVQAGYQVSLYDVNHETAKQAAAKIAAKLDEEQKERLQICRELKDLAGCSLLIEAATEKQDVKQGIFRELEQVVAEDAVLATNTSGISITAIASACRFRSRVIGLHFFNPPTRMPLVEVVSGLETASEVREAACRFVKSLSKKLVQAKDIPGFVVNRILTPMLNEAMTLLESGVASREDIDEAIKLGLGHPMGPLQLSDLIGLDTLLYFMEDLYRQTGSDRYRPSNLLRQLVAAGHLGRKTGKGFYEYR